MATEDGDKIQRETFVPFVNPMQGHFEEHFAAFTKMVTVMPHNCVMLNNYDEYNDKHLSFPCNSSDIWVASFPKAGTTWTQELLWGLVRGLDHKDSKLPFMNRFPFFEWDCLFDSNFDATLANLPETSVERKGEQWRILREAPLPRLIKTHLHRELMPRGARKLGSKIVYVMRDPRDVCVSLFYHTVKFLAYSGAFNDFVDLFLADTYEFGPYWSNMLGYWRVRDSDNLLLIRYEDLQQDLKGTINKVAEFIGVPVSEKMIPAFVQHLSFDSMKTNKATNNETIMEDISEKSDIKFMRKGIMGDYKNHLNEGQIKRFKDWTNKWLKDSDFPYYRE